MNIHKKFEEIKRSPEHIRLRWVWGLVAISMLFIFFIWLFSLQAMFKKDELRSSKNNQNMEDSLNKIKESAPSLKDTFIGEQSEGVVSDNGQKGLETYGMGE